MIDVDMHAQTTASVETYTLAEYSNDIRGYNVTQSVHVEAVWPGDPVGETRWVCLCRWDGALCLDHDQ